MVDSPPAPRPAQVRCRQIAPDDLGRVAGLLAEGFPDRGQGYWASGLERMARRAPVEGCPRFGFLLEADGAPVGAVLTIFTDMGAPGEPDLRCNISSWYVV